MSAKINLKKAREIVNKQIIQNKVEELPNKAARDREIYANKLREEEQQAQQAQRQQQQRQSVVFNNRPNYTAQTTRANVGIKLQQAMAKNQNNDLDLQEIHKKNISPSKMSPAKYKDTGKKYGDYFHENYEQYKDMPIYERDDGTYYLKTKNGYQKVGKLNKEGVVDKNIEKVDKKDLLKNYEQNKISDKESLEKAKKLGFKGTSVQKMSKKEVDRYWDNVEELQSRYKLTDKQVNEIWKENKIPNNIKKDDRSLKIVTELGKKLNSQINDDYKDLDIQDRIFLDTFKGSEKERRQMIDFLADTNHSAVWEDQDKKAKWFKKGEGNLLEQVLGTGANIVQKGTEGVGNFVEKAGDLLTEPLTLLEMIGNTKDVTTNRIGKKQFDHDLTQYEYRGKKYWYDPEENRLYEDGTHKELKHFNINVMKKTVGHDNPLANLGQAARETMTENDTQNLFEDNAIDKWIQKNTVLGSNVQSGIESIGEMLPLMATGMATNNVTPEGTLEQGAKSLVTTNALVFGEAYSGAKTEALRQGMSVEDATKSAFVQAAAETISENFFDSIPGMSSAGWGDEIVSQIAGKFEQKLGSKAGRLMYHALSQSGEGLEEIVSNGLTTMGNEILAYFDKNYASHFPELTGDMSRDMLNSMLSTESFDAFITAAFTSMILNTGTTILNNNEKNEIINDFAETNGLTNKEAKQILKQNLAEELSTYTPTGNFEDRLNAEQNATSKILGKMITNSVENHIELSEDGQSVRFYNKDLTYDEVNEKIDYLTNMITAVDDYDLKINLLEAASKLEIAKNMMDEQLSTLDSSLEEEVEEEVEDAETEEIAPTEEQDADVQEEEVNIDEKRNELEDLRAKKEENDKKVAQLNEQLNELRENKKEQISSAQLDKRISKQRRLVEDREERVHKERSQFGMVGEKLKSELKLANEKLTKLLEQKRNINKQTYNAVRVDNKNAIFDAESKPHGLHLSNLFDKNFEDFKSPFIEEYEDGVQKNYKITPKNPLEVEPIQLDNKKYRYRNVNRTIIESDTSIGALKKLISDEEFIKLSEMSKKELVNYLSNKYNQYDFTRYHDKAELLMAYGSILARDKGYDAILSKKSTNKNTEDVDNEIVVLKNDLLDNQFVDNIEKINQIKKQIEELTNNTFDQDIRNLEEEIDSLEQIEEPEVSEDTVSGDEIGADIEGIDEEIEVEGPEYAEVLEKMPYEEETFREKLTEDLENSKIKHAERMTKYVTRYYPFQELANKTKNNTLLPALHQKDSAWSQAQSDITYLQRDLNGNVVGEGLDSLYAPIEKSGKANLFDTYMYASRQATQSLDREMVLADKKDIARVKEIDKTRDKLMKDSSDLTAEELKDLLQQVKELDKEKQGLKKKAQEQMKEFVKEIEEENPEFKEWKQNILKYEKNLRNMLVESGVMSKKTSETFEQINPEYVRIYRDVHGKNANPLEYSKGKIKVSSPIKQTKGSTQDILPLKEALARQTLEVRQSATSNVFGQELYKILGGKGSKINRELINNNIITGANNTYGYVFYKNGKQITVPVNSVMKMALENTEMTKEDLAGKAIRKLSNLQRDMITGLSPIFTIKNVPKDFFDATINTKYPKTFLLNYGKAWANMISSSDTWKTYMAMGGNTINRFDYQKGFVNDTWLTAKDGTSIMKKALKSPIQMMRFISEHAEQVTRFAEFMNSLSNGESVQQAMYNAAEVTTNFGKGGTVTSKASRLGFNYLNASILGGYKAFENVKNHKGGKQFIKYAVQMAAFGILPALANSMVYKDDDEYKQLPDDIKDKNYVFKIGDNKFLKIPKGRLSSVISYYPQRIMEGRSLNPGELKKFTLDQIGPSNPLTGNIYYPIYNVLTNGNLAKNFWDSNIVPTRYASQTLQEQWKDGAVTSLGRNLSKGLHQIGINVSPFLIDYLYDNYSGFVGDITKPFMTKQADKNVLDTLFVVDTITNNKDLNDMYNLYDKYAYPTNEEDLIKYKYMNSQITKTYDKYAEIRKIQRKDDLTDDEKRTQVNAIREELNDLAHEAVNTVKNEKIKNVTVDGITYKRLRDALFKYDEEEGKWKKVSTRSKEYKNVVE